MRREAGVIERITLAGRHAAKAQPPRRSKLVRAVLLAAVLLAAAVVALTGLLSGCGFRGSQSDQTGPFGGSSIITTIVAAPFVPSRVYLGTQAGLFASADAGQHWSAGAAGSFTRVGVRAIAPSAVVRNTLWLVTGAPPTAATPAASATGTPTHAATATPQPTFPATAQTSASGAVWVSHDDGGTWHWASAGLPGQVSAVWAGTANANQAWVAVGGGLWLTNDDGLDWSAVGGLPRHTVAQAVLGTDSAGATILLGTNNGLLRSTDSGKHWSPVQGVRGSTHALVAAPLAPRTIYCLTDFGIYRSTDGGAHFSGQSYGLPDTQLAVGSNPNVLYALAGINIHRSNNGGRTWTLIQTATAGVAGIVALPPVNALATPTATATPGHGKPPAHATATPTQAGSEDTILVAFSNPAGMLISRDGGATWSQQAG